MGDKVRLSDRQMLALKPNVKLRDVWDTVIPGFGVRVAPSGRKTFVLAARFDGKHPTRRALGTYPAMTLAEAREAAADWVKLVKRGLDPKIEKKRQRLAEQRKRDTTFAAVAEDFIREKLPAERKGAEVERDIRRDLIPALGEQPITEITSRDVRDLIVAVKRRGPYQAHNTLGHAKRLFNWAIDQQVYGLETSPCDRLKPKAIIGEKKHRQRVLSDDEIRALWRAASRLPYPYGSVAQLLLLTGQRHSEVAEAKRSEFHPEFTALIHRQGEGTASIPWLTVSEAWKLWSVGQERFKSDASHMVPLSDDVCRIFAALPRLRGEHLFSTTFGEKPTVISDKVKRLLDARMLLTLKAIARKRGVDPRGVQLQPWVIHDIRRTVRTHLSAIRVPDHIAEMVIGHGRQGLQRVYDQHRYIAELREALAQWAARLRSIVEPSQLTENVIPFRVIAAE